MTSMTETGAAAGAFLLAASLALTGAAPSASAQSRAIVQCVDSAGHLDRACGWRYAAAYWRVHRAEHALRGLSDECVLRVIHDSERAAQDYDAGRPVAPVSTPCAVGAGLIDDGVLERACPDRRWTFANHGIVSCTVPEATSDQRTW